MKLSEFFGWITDCIKWAVEGVLRFLRESFAVLWALIAIVIAFALRVLDLLISFVNWLVDLVAGIQVPAFNFSLGAGASNALAIGNTFFPLDEACRFFVAYCGLYIVMTVIRWVKSFIPRVHGWGISGD